MPVIHTQRNYITVGRALEGDRFVATYIMPQWGPVRLLTTQPIEQLEVAIQWCIDMADVMDGPLMVVPIRSEDELLRKIVETIGFEGLHWDKDPDEQRAGRGLLISMGVLKE